MNQDNDLNLDNYWSVTEAGFEQITTAIRLLSTVGNPRILEFGSGLSTVRLALEFPDAEIVTLEHDKESVFNLAKLLSKYQITNVRILFCLLGHVRVKSLHFLGYNPIGIIDLELGSITEDISLDRYLKPNHYDVAIVDGPPFYILGGREASIHQAIKHLKPGGLLFVDDANRPAEREAIDNCSYYYLDNTFSEISAHSTNKLKTFIKKTDCKITSYLRTSNTSLLSKHVAIGGALSCMTPDAWKQFWPDLFRDPWSDDRSERLRITILNAYGSSCGGLYQTAPREDYVIEASVKLLVNLWYHYSFQSLSAVKGPVV